VIAIIGAGPSGAYAALKLAEAGEKVALFEEHALVGRPVQCTGIVTKALFDLVEPSEEYLINELNSVRIIGPSSHIEIPLKEFVLCRDKFDPWLVKKAVAAGAELHLNHRFVGLKGNKALFSNGKSYFFDKIIGADGPSSSVGRAAGLLKERKYYFGAQATIKAKFNSKQFTTYFGSVAPGFFAWVVPESSTRARVGIAAQKYGFNAYEKLLRLVPGVIVDRQAGPIPLFDPNQKARKDNVYLVGDAAGLCKNTTGGGIITGMISGKLAAESILTGKSYEKLLAPLRRELRIHQKIRETLNKFTDADYEKLISWMSVPKVKEILYKYPREFPSRFMLKLVLAQPKLLYFLKYLI